MAKIEYGPVFISRGPHKGRILYYDDDDELPNKVICYAGHPLDFVGYYTIPMHYIREPTIDDLLARRQQIWRELTDYAVDGDWDIDPSDIHVLWSEKSMVVSELHGRRMFGELDQLDNEGEVFLCHSSSDKGMVRMVHDDLKNLKINCWLDENKIKIGDSIISKISVGLDSSKTMIIFLSPNSVKSMWAKKEWQSFLARQLSEGGIRILPALLEECEIPSIMADVKYADFREGYYDGFKQIYNALK